MNANPANQSRIRDFIKANTLPLSPPLVPELTLRLAEESLPIWRKTEEELGEFGVPPPYWAFAWAGGQALARYILDIPELVSGQTVVDIGSGSGMVAIAAKLAGARRVTANDIDAYAIEASSMNAAANGAEVELYHGNLIGEGIRASAVFLTPPLSSPNIIFIGDVFYEKELADCVLALAEVALSSGCRVLVGDPRRSYFPEKRFAKLAEYVVPVTRELEDNEIKNAAVWEFIG